MQPIIIACSRGIDNERRHGRAVKRSQRVVERLSHAAIQTLMVMENRVTLSNGEHQPLEAAVRPRPERTGEVKEFFECFHNACECVRMAV